MTKVEQRLKKLEQELKDLKAGKTCAKAIRTQHLIFEDKKAGITAVLGLAGEGDCNEKPVLFVEYDAG